MPKLKYVQRAGDTKARLAALEIGESFVLPTFEAARAINTCDRRLGIRVSMKRLARGRPERRITRIA